VSSYCEQVSTVSMETSSGYLDDDNLAGCVTNGQLSSAMCLSCKWNTYIFVHFQVRGVVVVVRPFITILPIIVTYLRS
jgi:hypothetical protein